MAKYTVTRACGHKETVALFGKGKDREWRLENVEASKLCYDCYQAEQAKKNAAAAQEAQEQGLPELTGTDKQVPWAESIRLKVRERFGELVAKTEAEIAKAEKSKTYGEKEIKAARDEIVLARETLEHILASCTRASWWIDNREIATSDLALQILLEKNIESAQKSKAEAAPAAIEAKAEATVRPENPKTETVAEIRTLENAIEVDFPEKREDFRELVKFKLGMCWNGACWRREIKAVNGTPADRAAEAGHKLLSAGFPIRIYDAEIRQRAIDGSYEPEQTRWIRCRKADAREYPGWFAIKWGRHEDFYDAARKIKGSRYSKPSVVVPAEQFEQVLDFAQMYGFSLSEGAQELADKARQTKEAALVVKVNPVQNDVVIPGSKPPVLDVPEKVEVANEFKD